MGVVTIADAWPATGRPFTAADLDQMPDDGHRYELLDGVLIVSPRPSWAHQGVAGALLALLRQACPPELRAFAEPDVDQPELIVFELRDGTYEQVRHVLGDEPFRAERPFAVEVLPSRLVAGLLPG